MEDLLRRGVSRRGVMKGAAALAVAGTLGRRAFAADAGELVVLGWIPYWSDAATRLFKEKTGITLKMVGASTDQEMFTKLTAGGSGGYDVVYANAGWTPLYQQAGLIEPLQVADIPAAQYLHKEFVEAASLPFVAEPGRALLFYPNMWSPLALTWLKDVVAAPEQPSWTMMWDSSVPKGSLIFAGGGGDDFLAVGGLARGVPRDKVYAMGEAELADVVEAMRKLKPFQILVGAEPEFRARFRDGRATIGLSSQIGAASLINDEAGKPIALGAIPKEGSIGWVDGPMLVKDAKNRANAMAFFDFIGSDLDYGRLIFRDTGGSPCSARLTGELLAGGGTDAALIKTIQADNPKLALDIVMQAPPSDPAAYAAAWDSVLAG